MKYSIVALAFLAAVASLPVQAQSLETVVVTGARAEYDANVTPHTYVLRRADHLITKVRVVCDTRDPTKRKEELKQTLRSMIREATKSGTISLGVGDEIVADLTEKMLDKVIIPDARQDTSNAFVIVKTRVTAADQFDDATGRIEKFIDNTPKTGRSEIEREKPWNLTIIGPEQYRGAVIARIAEDAKQTAMALGLDYAIKIEGLQHPLAWYQKGPLDLALYIPYVLTVEPRPVH